MPACSDSGDTGTGTSSSQTERLASSNLDTTPLSAADYKLYESIMSGASALLVSLEQEDRRALELAREVDAGRRKATASDELLLARARALKDKDETLAELQGIAPRFRQVKEKVNAVIGPAAQPPDKDDPVARENRRFLEAHRANIERLQAILRDPLSRSSQTQ